MQADEVRGHTPARATIGRCAMIAGLALLIGACSAPPYPPEGRTFAAASQSQAPQGTTTTPASFNRTADQGAPRAGPSDTVATLDTRKDRWWPDWSDPANWFLDEDYRL